MSDDELLRRLERMEAIMRIAFGEALEREGARVRADPVDAALLGACAGEEWQPTTALQKRVAEKTAKSTRTVRDRLAALTARGVLESRLSAGKREYRASGLI